jgi:hypothetical protein
MRWLKHIISVAMVIVAAGIALSTALSDHSDDYGRVSLPQGGVLELPKGTVTVFYNQLGEGSDPIRQLDTPLTIQAAPVGGGPAVPVVPVNGETPVAAVSRSETIGELGAVAKLRVPASGAYMVSGTTDLPAGTSLLKVGTNAGAALISRWKLLAGLLIGAFLIVLIPVPRHARRWEDERDAPTGWSSDPRAPYAG